MLFVRPSLCSAARHLDGDPLIAQHQPRIHVRWEFLVREQHHIARLQGQCPGREFQTETGVGGERDFRWVCVDQLRDPEPGGGQAGEQLAIRQEVRRGTFGGELIECATRPLGYGSDRGVIEIGRIGGPRELRRA